MAGRSAYSRRYAPYPAVEANHGGPTKVFISNLNYSTPWQAIKEHFRSVGEVRHVDILPGRDGISSGNALVEFSRPEFAAVAIRELSDTMLDGRIINVRADREQAGPSRVALPRAPQGQRLQVRDEGRPVRQFEDEPMDPVSYAKWYREWQESQIVGTAAYRSRFENKVGPIRQRTSRAPPPIPEPMVRGPPSVGRRGNRGPPFQPPVVAARAPALGGKVFFGNLPWHTSWQDLKDFLRDNGFEAFRVSLSQDAEGRPRGHGLVTFEQEGDAERAVAMFDQFEFDGRPLVVHLDRFS
eukprot:EG_transcript_18218